MSSIGIRGFAALRHRDFALYLGVRFCASVAAQMIIVAVGWQVYHITGRLLDLGLIGLSQFLPFLCLVLIAGHVADHFDRRLILLGVILAQMACASALLVFAAGNIRHTLPIFLVLACLGVARAFQMPAAQSFLPNLVPPAMLGNAVALNSSVFQVATIAGPSLGGLVYAIAQKSAPGSGGAGLVYALGAALLCTAVILMALIGTRRTTGGRVVVSLSSLLQGLRFVWGRKSVLGAMSLDLFAVLFGGASALLPAFTQDVLHAGPEVFGLLRTAPGVGAVLTAAVLAFHPIKRRAGVIMFSGVALFGAATVVFGLTAHFWVALAALVVLGAGDMVSVFVRSVLVQLETPDEIRGRVSAVNSVFIGASNELGEFESGLTAAWFGLVPAIVAGGAATLAVTIIWARFLFPGLWRMQAFEQT
ncbi:MAG: MFS transporter [Steroidobacteraceae bacterium]|jgi:MFS family permease